MPRRRAVSKVLQVGAAVVCVAVMLTVSGCSDDVVCPEPAPDTVPYISARVIERADLRETATTAQVVCIADPLPSLLVAFVSGRELSDLSTTPDLEVVASLEDELIVWQPGATCSLAVTTNYGYATAVETVPQPVSVEAPETIAFGDSLLLTWRPSPDADYYSVSASLSAGACGVEELASTTRETFAVFHAEDISAPGILSGFVSSVTGPFPQSGTEGNVGGDGWGFFMVSYGDSGSAFQVSVLEPEL